MSYLNRDEIAALGFVTAGEDVRISARASIYGAERIAIGNHVRIDDFCILSAGEGGIEIGSYVHIAAYAPIMGAERVTMGDYSGLSSRVSVYSSSDDYSGRTMTNPTVPDKYRAVDSQPIEIGRHVIVGAGSVILPGVTLGEGSAVGALSLVIMSCEPFSFISGAPARMRRSRERGLLDLEAQFHQAKL